MMEIWGLEDQSIFGDRCHYTATTLNCCFLCYCESFSQPPTKSTFSASLPVVSIMRPHGWTDHQMTLGLKLSALRTLLCPRNRCAQLPEKDRCHCCRATVRCILIRGVERIMRLLVSPNFWHDDRRVPVPASVPTWTETICRIADQSAQPHHAALDQR